MHQHHSFSNLPNLSNLLGCQWMMTIISERLSPITITSAWVYIQRRADHSSIIVFSIILQLFAEVRMCLGVPSINHLPPPRTLPSPTMLTHLAEPLRMALADRYSHRSNHSSIIPHPSAQKGTTVVLETYPQLELWG